MAGPLEIANRARLRKSRQKRISALSFLPRPIPFGVDSADQAGQRFFSFRGGAPGGSSRPAPAVSSGPLAVAGLFASGLQVVPPALAGRQRPFGPPGTAFLQCHRTAVRHITITETAGGWAARPEQRSLERLLISFAACHRTGFGATHSCSSEGERNVFEFMFPWLVIQ